VPIKVDEALAKFSDERESLERSGHLTPAGLQDRLRKSAAASVVPELKKGRGKLIAARSAVAAKRAELMAPTIDKSDVAAALVRRELREYMRGLPVPERMSLLLQGDDPRLMVAYLELPALVPLPDEFRRRLEEVRLEKLHGPEVQQLQQADEVYELVQAVVDTGFQVLNQELAFRGDQRAFDAFVAAAA
jgi:hypothetical protein